jgi:hypothetical protein
MAQMGESKTKEVSGDSVSAALTEITEPSKCEFGHAENATDRDVLIVTTHWTAKKAIAAASLAGLYTGAPLSNIDGVQQDATNVLTPKFDTCRIADYALLCRWCIDLY